MGYGRGQLTPHQTHSMTPQQHVHQLAPKQQQQQVPHTLTPVGRTYSTIQPQRTALRPNYPTMPLPKVSQQRKFSTSTATRVKNPPSATVTTRNVMDSSARRKSTNKTKKEGLHCTPLSNDVTRRLALAEAVAQKTVNGMITDELKEEEYRTSLYLDAGVMGINPEDISKLTREGKTEFQIIERCYSQLKDSIAPADHLEMRKRKVTQIIIEKAKVPKFPALGPNEDPLKTTSCTLKQGTINDALLAIGA